MMAQDNSRARLFTRRALLLGGAQAGLLAVLVGRLYDLQILKGDRYRTLAEENRISLRFLPPPRGQILDRGNVPLALNQQNYRLVLIPERVDDAEVLLAKIQTLIPLTEGDADKIVRDLKRRRNRQAILVYDNLTWEQVAALSLHMPELGGMDIEVGEARFYPYGADMAHVLGHTGPLDSRDIDTADKEGRAFPAIPGLRIGKNGLEKQYDSLLCGKVGNVQLEVNAHGRVIRELARQKPLAGHDVTLSLDIGLQQDVLQQLAKTESSSAVVLDVHTGAVYALASHPGFDPNAFVYGIHQTEWDQLTGNPFAPLLNKAIGGLYAPGSTFKIVTTLAGLEAGLLDPQKTVFCPGYFDLGGHLFHCWKHGGHGTVNLRHAMAGSCDTYFYQLGQHVGIDRLQAMAQRLGLGSKVGIDLPHERGGLMPGRAWKKANRHHEWQLGETLITAIGQGYITATPLQLAIMMARVVNGGHAVTPHLIRAESSAHGAHEGENSGGDSLGFDADNLSLLQDALAAVVTEPIGTAYGARILEDELAMAGKTGTAQVRRISTAERAEGVIANADLAWKERDHALFVGYAPLTAPQYAVAVVVEHGGSGAHDAAPIARDILLACQKRNVAGV